MKISNLRNFLLILVFLICAILVNAKPSSKPKFTLAPETLAEVKQLLKVKPTVPAQTAQVDFGFRIAQNQPIIFQEPEHQLQSRATSSEHQCPNPRDRYHSPSGKCFTPGTGGGPCGDNMLFYAQGTNKLYGECDCDYNAEIPLVFHSPTATCYPIYDQAYCGNDEWLVFNAQDRPVCEKRKCPVHRDRVTLYFKGRCAFWDEWNSACDNTYEKLIFLPDSLEPTCAEPPVSEQSNFNIPKLKCKPGSSQDIQGNCREKIKFNFGGR